MAVPGMADPAPGGPSGAEQYEALLTGGVPKDQADDWKTTRTQALLAGGVPADKVAAYWGEGEPAAPGIAVHVQANAARNDQPQEAKSPLDYMAAGWDMSVVGLLHNKALPKMTSGPSAPVWAQVLQGATQLAGDSPYILGGMVGGAGAGALVPGAGEVGASELIGGGFGAAALPQGMREVLLDAYGAHHVMNAHDAMKVAGENAMNTVKAGTVGAIANLVGGPVGAKVMAVTGNSVLAMGAEAIANSGAATAAGSFMDGQVPDAKSFTAASIVALGFAGFHAAGRRVLTGSEPQARRVQSNLQTLYNQTGVPPWEAVKAAEHDPILRQEIMAQDPNGNPATPKFRALAPNEPEPFKRPTAGPKAPKGEEAKPGITLGTLDTVGRLETGGLKNPNAAVSPTGAVGRYQIEPGTARQYGFDPSRLHEEAYNEHVARTILFDLNRRFNGDMNAILIGYNAGPGRAARYMAAGPGTRLEATADPALRGGIRFTKGEADRDESFLPLETQKYLAKARLYSGDKGAQMPRLRDLEGHDGSPLSTEVQPEETPSGASVGAANVWEKASEDDIVNELRANIGEQPTRELTNPSSTDAFLTDHFSWLTSMRRVDDRLVQEGLLNRRTEEGTEDAFRQTLASGQRANFMIRYGGVNAEDFSVNKDIPSYYTAAKVVKDAGGTVDGWEAYMLAKRTMEKAQAGIDTGFNAMASRAAVMHPDMIAKYEEGTQVLQRVQDGFLKYMVDSGRLSADAAERMKGGNQTYVTMRRIMGDMDAYDPSKPRGRGVASVLSRMEGSDGQIVKPIMAMMDNMSVGVRAADKNRALGRLVAAAETSPEVALQFGLRKIGPLDPNEAELEQVLTKAGIPPDKLAGAIKAFGPLVTERAAIKPNEFVYYRDGIAEKWQIDDPLLAKAIQMAPTPQMADGIAKVLTNIARFVRAGIVIGNFPIRMALWHSDNMFVMDEEHTLPVVTTLKGILPAIMKDATWQKFLASGAIVHISADLTQDRMLLDMQRGGELEKTGILDRAWNSFKHPLEAAEAIATALDASNRIGYGLTVEKRFPDILPAKVGAKARKAGIDYAERGTAQVTNFLANLIPFFRPHMLGTKQGWESLTTKQANSAASAKMVGGTLAAAIVAITIPKVLNYMLNQEADKELPDGQKYRDYPRWQRTAMLVTPPVNGVRYTIRQPANFGFIFGDLVERAMDAFQEHDPHAFDDWMQDLAKEYIPSLFPVAAQPATEVIANHDFNTGRQLRPDSVKDLLPEDQYTAHTSEIGKKVAAVINPGIRNIKWGEGVSPIDIDHLIKGYTGTAGQSLLEALNAPMIGHAEGIADVVGNLFVKGVVARTPGASAQPIEDMYSELDGQEKAYRSARKEWKARDPEGETDAPEKPEKLRYLEEARAALKVQRSALDAISKNKSMTLDEQRVNSEALYHDMVTIAKGALAGQEPPEQ